jgi:hypothetical protein
MPALDLSQQRGCLEKPHKTKKKRLSREKAQKRSTKIQVPSSIETPIAKFQKRSGVPV